jgi:Flp pilus assembly protein TadD
MLKRSINPTASQAGCILLAAIVVLLPLLTGGCTTTQGLKTAAVKVEPTADTAILHQQAVSLMQQEKWQDAVTRLEVITAQQAGLSGPWLNLGIAYSKRGNSESAEAAFRKSIDANAANIEAYNQLGLLYRRTGRLEEARFMYETALKSDPDNSNIHWNLGILHDKYLPDPRKALLHYRRYQQLTGTNDPQLQAWINSLSKDTQENSLAVRVNP